MIKAIYDDDAGGDVEHEGTHTRTRFASSCVPMYIIHVAAVCTIGICIRTTFLLVNLFHV